MNAFLKSARKSLGAFARDESGAQVVEYALIIAVVSIALVLALGGLTDTPFTDMIARVASCLKNAACT